MPESSFTARAQPPAAASSRTLALASTRPRPRPPVERVRAIPRRERSHHEHALLVEPRLAQLRAASCELATASQLAPPSSAGARALRRAVPVSVGLTTRTAHVSAHGVRAGARSCADRRDVHARLPRAARSRPRAPERFFPARRPARSVRQTCPPGPTRAPRLPAAAGRSASITSLAITPSAPPARSCRLASRARANSTAGPRRLERSSPCASSAAITPLSTSPVPAVASAALAPATATRPSGSATKRVVALEHDDRTRERAALATCRKRSPSISSRSPPSSRASSPAVRRQAVAARARRAAERAACALRPSASSTSGSSAPWRARAQTRVRNRRRRGPGRARATAAPHRRGTSSTPSAPARRPPRAGHASQLDVPSRDIACSERERTRHVARARAHARERAHQRRARQSGGASASDDVAGADFVEDAARRSAVMSAGAISPIGPSAGAPRGMPMSTTSTRRERLPGMIHRPASPRGTSPSRSARTARLSRAVDASIDRSHVTLTTAAPARSVDRSPRPSRHAARPRIPCRGARRRTPRLPAARRPRAAQRADPGQALEVRRAHGRKIPLTHTIVHLGPASRSNRAATSRRRRCCPSPRPPSRRPSGATARPPAQTAAPARSIRSRPECRCLDRKRSLARIAASIGSGIASRERHDDQRCRWSTLRAAYQARETPDASASRVLPPPAPEGPRLGKERSRAQQARAAARVFCAPRVLFSSAVGASRRAVCFRNAGPLLGKRAMRESVRRRRRARVPASRVLGSASGAILDGATRRSRRGLAERLLAVTVFARLRG